MYTIYMKHKLTKLQKKGWMYEIESIYFSKHDEKGKMITFYYNNLRVGSVWGKAARLRMKELYDDGFSFEKHIWWDDNEEAPTIEPASTVMEYGPDRRFHGYIRNGEVEVLDDSSEEYKQ